MVTPTKSDILTVAAFDDLAENAESVLEFIGGEVYEVPSNPFVSFIAGIIFGELYLYLKGKNLGYLTGEAGGYMVAGERYAPDVAYISKIKQPQLARKGYNPNPPDLAVEVVSDPTNAEELDKLRKKMTNYLADGVVVWVVKPDTRTLEIHAPGQKLVTLREGDTLQQPDDADLLPGFTLTISDIFPDEPQTDDDSAD